MQWRQRFAIVENHLEFIAAGFEAYHSSLSIVNHIFGPNIKLLLVVSEAFGFIEGPPLAKIAMQSGHWGAVQPQINSMANVKNVIQSQRLQILHTGR